MNAMGFRERQPASPDGQRLTGCARRS